MGSTNSKFVLPGDIMKKIGFIMLSVVFLSAASADDTVTVICTTTALEALAEEVGGGTVDVVSLVQPGVCPSHFDVRPSHIAEVSHASLVLYHGVEPWLEDLLAASQNETVEKVHVAGPWNTPQLAKEKIELVRDALSRAQPEQRDTYKKNADRAVETIDTVADTIKREAEPLTVETITVLCMDWQRSLIEWIGFDIAASYAPPETLSVKDVNDLIVIGREKDVALVCDNLQSGTEIGAEIAAEIHAHHVVLTNFPDAVPETETVTKMIQYNAQQLLDAAKKYREDKERISELESQLEEETWKRKLFESIAVVLLAVCLVEAAVLYMRRE